MDAYYFERLFPIQREHGLDLNACRDVSAVFNPVLALFAMEQRGDAASAATLPIEDAESKDDSAPPPPPPPAAVLGRQITTSGLGDAGTASPVMSIADFGAFASAQSRSLDERFAAMATTFPPAETGGLVSVAEARLCLAMAHCQRLAEQQRDVVAAIEALLRQQLIAAIGKVVGPADFQVGM